jgi:putative radical SAM enzyme (TIGR03279 family)
LSSAKTLRERLQRHDLSNIIPASLSVAEQPAGVKVLHVQEGSLAEKAGIRAGDRLISFNGKGIRDTVDYFFYGTARRLDIGMETADGTPTRKRITKPWPEADLGMEVEQFKTQACGCNCVFCFVHQLPDSMRSTLYVKDEDYRHSFLQGSYITGVTLKKPDLDRIAEQRLTPLYVSVHAINEELRRWLLGIRRSYPILELLDFFRANRLQLHTQIVLCPGHNDGEELEKTVATLLGYHPTVQSVAVVPLGLTKWREGLPDLNPVTPQYARQFIRDTRGMIEASIARFGEPVVMLSDEWYLIAKMRIPGYTQYAELPQLSNGVGMVYHFYRDAARARRRLQKPLPRPWRVAAITSTLSGPVLDRIIGMCHRCEGLTVERIPVVNTVFGETIHVTGLLCGRDIQAAIQANPGYDQYLLPGNCLRRWDERFLDDLTLGQLRENTGALVTPVLGGAADFAETILEHAAGRAHRVEDHIFLRPHWSNT